jgi:hypothetical protein
LEETAAGFGEGKVASGARSVIYDKEEIGAAG